MKVEECIFFRLASSSRSGNQFWARRVEQFGLTGVQALIINFLGEENGITLQLLAERLRLSNATLTGIVDRLEKTDWVKRLRNPDDRRSILVSLTEKGRSVAAELNKTMAEANREFLTRFTEQEEILFKDFLNRLYHTPVIG